ncbi:MAG: hybrid sensor histidine kinase/response regulator, partial [Haliea sp.]
MTDLHTQAMRASAQAFPGDTPTAKLLRAHDWAATSLGEPGAWPPALRVAAALAMDSAIPMWLAWGERMAMVYNAAYAEILGDKHPAALGRPLDEVWPEIWPDVQALIATALAGEGIYREDMPLRVRRHGQLQQTWFTFAYTPLRHEGGAVGGLLCSVWETTEKVLTHARLAESEFNTRALVEA